MALYAIKDLIDLLKAEKFIFIQVHNFPDPDAVASAFGLQHFFKSFDIESYLVYDTEVQRISLKKMIRDLNIDLRHVSEYRMQTENKIILVDGCKGNSNVTNLIGHEVAVIDHHEVALPENVDFIDIRPQYGACASIVASYYLEYGVDIPTQVATALMIGISTDTQNLTRHVSACDLKAYYHCYNIADKECVMSVIRNNISTDDLAYFELLIQNLKFFGRVGYCFFKSGCDQNLLGILSNFVLTIAEIEFVILCAQNNGEIIFSLRSEDPHKNAASIICTLLDGRGVGGGHADMAGGVIHDRTLFNQTYFFNDLMDLINS